MHDAALAWVKEQWIPADVVVEIGGRNVNYGTARELWPNADYTSIDLLPGDGVDWVGDFMEFTPQYPPDLVVCMEVAEHCDYWKTLLHHAWQILQPGGTLLFTAAGPDRLSHSGIDGGFLRPGEWYENIHPDDLRVTLEQWFDMVFISWSPGHPAALASSNSDPVMGDVYAVAWK